MKWERRNSLKIRSADNIGWKFESHRQLHFSSFTDLFSFLNLLCSLFERPQTTFNQVTFTSIASFFIRSKKQKTTSLTPIYRVQHNQHLVKRKITHIAYRPVFTSTRKTCRPELFISNKNYFRPNLFFQIN